MKAVRPPAPAGRSVIPAWLFILPLILLWVLPLAAFLALQPVSGEAQSTALAPPVVTALTVGKRTGANAQAVDTMVSLPPAQQVQANRPGVVTHIYMNSGERLTDGTRLVSINYETIVAFTGSDPLYRDLTLGDFGPDVQSLAQFLVHANLLARTAVADHYTAAIAGGVARLERSTGAPVDGNFSLSMIAFVPKGVTNIGVIAVKIGDNVGPGTSIFDSESSPTSIRFSITGSEGQAPEIDSAQLTLKAGDLKLLLMRGLTIPASTRAKVLEFLERAVSAGIVSTTTAGNTSATTYTGAVLEDTTPRTVGVVPTSSIYVSDKGTRCIFVWQSSRLAPVAHQLQSADFVSGELGEVAIPVSYSGQKVIRNPLALDSRTRSACK
jgi:hypothetical protein